MIQLKLKTLNYKCVCGDGGWGVIPLWVQPPHTVHIELESEQCIRLGLIIMQCYILLCKFLSVH